MSTRESQSTTDASVTELTNLVEDLRERVEQQDERMAALEGEIETLEAENEQLRERVAEQGERVDEQQKRIDEQDERIETLEGRAHVEWEGPNPAEITIHDSEEEHSVEPYRAITDRPSFDMFEALEDRVTELEAVAEMTPGDDAGNAAVPGHHLETSLEQLVAMPEKMVDRELTPNSERARFLAADVRDYTKSVPAGWAITSGELRRVLNAYDDSGHTETVRRVFEILDDFGSEEVTVVKKRGTKRAIFDESLVERLTQLDQLDHTVVMTAEA